MSHLSLHPSPSEQPASATPTALEGLNTRSDFSGANSLELRVVADGAQEDPTCPVVLSVLGEIDLFTVPALRDTLTRAFDEFHVPVLILDMNQCQYVDSMGLGAVVAAHKRAASRGACLVLCTTPRIARLLDLTGLDRIVHAAPTLEAARSLAGLLRTSAGRKDGPTTHETGRSGAPTRH